MYIFQVYGWILTSYTPKQHYQNQELDFYHPQNFPPAPLQLFPLFLAQATTALLSVIIGQLTFSWISENGNIY